MIDIGRRMRELRLAMGLTQTEAADRAGMYQPGWSDYERGKRIPGLPTLYRIANALRVSLHDLLSEPPSGGS